MNQNEKKLIYYAMEYKGNYKKIKDAIERGKIIEAYKIEDALSRLTSKVTTILSDDYPETLKMIPDPPFVLFYHGHLELVKQPCISMVGMREPTQYGVWMASSFARALREDFVIVSGLAKGIDAICHLNAKQTIAVLGCGIDVCYPKNNFKLYAKIKEEGLILSEYPGQVQPQKYYFPWRNRIVSGLGLAVIVVQANMKSGSMITCRHALEQGRPVFAIPCNLTEPHGTLGLLKDGAIILTSKKDIFDELGVKMLDNK